MENKTNTHKHLPKLIALQKRIEMWKQVGEACTEHEWNDMESRLNDLNVVIEDCIKHPQYHIPSHLLKLYNNYYKQYNCKPGEKLAFTNNRKIL